jgi:hypothetical protein
MKYPYRAKANEWPFFILKKTAFIFIEWRVLLLLRFGVLKTKFHVSGLYQIKFILTYLLQMIDLIGRGRMSLISMRRKTLMIGVLVQQIDNYVWFFFSFLFLFKKCLYGLILISYECQNYRGTFNWFVYCVNKRCI